MHITVLVERIADNSYRARSAEPFALSAEGTTREDAVAKLRAECQARLQQGVELISMELGPRPHPWMDFAGMFRGSEAFDEVVEIMAKQRREMDLDDTVP